MAIAGTINARLPETLKEHGSQVLERNGVSTTQAVRKLFEYLDREQDVPPWMLDENAESKFDERRKLARTFAENDFVPANVDVRDEYRKHVLEKYS